MFPSVIQPSLFATTTAGADLRTTLIRAWRDNRQRRELSHGAYLDIVPDFLPRPDALFTQLMRDIPWETERRPMYGRIVDVPRLQAFYEADAPLPNPGLEATREALSACYEPEYGQPFTTLGACLYRSGSDSVAWHADDSGPAKHSDTGVAVITLGAARSFLCRPTAGGAGLKVAPGHGDLLVMGGSFQRTWLHCVPKVDHALGPRISLQFRMPKVR